MARVVAVFDDLLLGSNVLGMLRAGGHEAQLTGGADVHPDDAAVLIVDLAATSFDGVQLVEALRERGELGRMRTLGVYSHVDVQTRRRAFRRARGSRPGSSGASRSRSRARPWRP